MDAAAETPPTPDVPRSPGALLAAERERQGLSRADIAQRLHMSAGQIEALEAGDYARLPRGTFLRGFVRNYARVLGLKPEAMLGALEGDAPGDKAPAIVVPSQNIRFDPLGARLASPYMKALAVATTAIVLGFAALYWWFYIRPAAMAGTNLRKSVAEAPKVESRAAETRTPEAAPPAQPVIQPAIAEAPRPEPAPAEARAEEPRKAAPEKLAVARSEAPGEAPVIDAAQVIAAGGGVVRLRFKGISWV
jgi:cytoskeleton protein RodZ